MTKGSIGLLLAAGCMASILTHSQAIPAKESAPATARFLKPYSANYKASISGVPFGGSGSRSLMLNDDGSWTLDFGASAALFKMEETSTFAVKNNRVVPQQYTYERPGLLGRRPLQTADFDWKTKKVNWKRQEDKWSIELQDGAIDNLAYQLQLRLDIAAGKRDGLSYLIADDDEVYRRDFVIEGEEVLETQAGKLETVRIKIKRDTDKRATWIWLAKNWNYFLVKFLQKEGGSEYVIEFKDAVIDGKPIASKYDRKST